MALKKANVEKTTQVTGTVPETETTQATGTVPEAVSVPTETENQHASENAHGDSNEDSENDPGRLVTVRNLSGSDLRQHGTGMVIAAKAVKDMANDGWLKNQIRAGLLKKV